MTIVIHSKVVDVRELRQVIRAQRADPHDPSSAVQTTEINLGWFIRMEGSWEALHVGFEKPEFEKGDKVQIRISKA